jgi:hypothetical protein
MTFTESQIMAILISLVWLAFFCILMGRRRAPDPRDYRSIDIEAAAEDVASWSTSSDNSDGTRRRKRRRRNRGQTRNLPAEATPQFWIICPCRSCERHNRPHMRLHSIVQTHIRQHLMGEKFKVFTTSPICVICFY